MHVSVNMCVLVGRRHACSKETQNRGHRGTECTSLSNTKRTCGLCRSGRGRACLLPDAHVLQEPVRVAAGVVVPDLCVTVGANGDVSVGHGTDD